MGKCQPSRNTASARPPGGSTRWAPTVPATAASTVGPWLPSPNVPGAGWPVARKPSHIANRPWFHLPMPQAGPVQVSSPAAAAAIVPHSSCRGSMAWSDRSTPASPGPDRAATSGRLGCPAARSVCPGMVSAENITSASSGSLAREVSVTRNRASGSPLASASPGTSGLNAVTATSTGKSGSDSTTRPNGYPAWNWHCPNRGSPASGAGDPCQPSTSSSNRAPSQIRAWAGMPAPATRQAKNVSAEVRPLSGWFSSSQSRNCPRPPNPTVPVPIPPSGSEIRLRSRPE